MKNEVEFVLEMLRIESQAKNRIFGNGGNIPFTNESFEEFELRDVYGERVVSNSGEKRGKVLEFKPRNK